RAELRGRFEQFRAAVAEPDLDADSVGRHEFGDPAQELGVEDAQQLVEQPLQLLEDVVEVRKVGRRCFVRGRLLVRWVVLPRGSLRRTRFFRSLFGWARLLGLVVFGRARLLGPLVVLGWARLLGCPIVLGRVAVGWAVLAVVGRWAVGLRFWAWHVRTSRLRPLGPCLGSLVGVLRRDGQL